MRISPPALRITPSFKPRGETLPTDVHGGVFGSICVEYYVAVVICTGADRIGNDDQKESGPTKAGFS